jgi:hypothetical protein
MKERIALAAGTVLTAIGIYLAPSWRNILTDVCLQAAVFAGGTIALMYVTRFLGRRGIAIERIALALFLAGMPLVYIVRWLVSRAGAGSGWLWVELSGLVVYATLAVLGLKVSPWFLVAGIAGHGLAWDSWHYYANETYIPHWYAIACLLADIGLGAYVGARIPTWHHGQLQAGTASKESQAALAS